MSQSPEQGPLLPPEAHGPLRKGLEITDIQAEKLLREDKKVPTEFVERALLEAKVSTDQTLGPGDIEKLRAEIDNIYDIQK